MAFEARLAEALTIAPRGTAQRVRALLERYGLPVERPAGCSSDDLLEAMRLDKKARAGAVRFALPRAIGAMHGDATHGWTVAASDIMVRDLLAVTE
jgi:3-dehydroquinate synthase